MVTHGRARKKRAKKDDSSEKLVPKPTVRNTKARTHILETAQRIIGTKGFAPVGLNEILVAARVPKGSFYYHFPSKEAFGEALLEHYFTTYLAEMDEILSSPGRNSRKRLDSYWAYWRRHQENQDPDGKCLAVKLGPEVSDMSEGMRLVLKSGTTEIVTRIEGIIRAGVSDGSISTMRGPTSAAHALYELWIGASVMSKISRNRISFDAALAATDRILSGEAF